MCMRIGLDARMVFYTSAGIAQYIRRLVKGLSHLVTDDEIILLQSRKDESMSIENAPFSWHPLWTPGHNRFEQATLPLELLPYRLELLHSPDHIPPMRRTFHSVVTVH